MSGDTWLVETLDTAALVLQAIFEAHPREWTDAAPAWLYAGPKVTRILLARHASQHINKAARGDAQTTS